MYGAFHLFLYHVDSLSPDSQSACSSSAHIVQKPQSCNSRKPTSKRPLRINARNWEGHEFTHADKRFISVTPSVLQHTRNPLFSILQRSLSPRFIGCQFPVLSSAKISRHDCPSSRDTVGKTSEPGRR